MRLPKFLRPAPSDTADLPGPERLAHDACCVVYQFKEHSISIPSRLATQALRFGTVFIICFTICFWWLVSVFYVLALDPTMRKALIQILSDTEVVSPALPQETGV